VTVREADTVASLWHNVGVHIAVTCGSDVPQVGTKRVRPDVAGMEPKHGFRVVERARVDMPKDMSISDIAGYVESWSAYATYRSRHPGVWPVEVMAFENAVGLQRCLTFQLTRTLIAVLESPSITLIPACAWCADAADPVCALRDALLAAFDTKDEQHSLTVVWPVFIILAKHPEPAPGG